LKKLKVQDIQQINALIQTVSLDIAPEAQRVSDLIEIDEKRWISTGDLEVDNLLGGGVRRGVITEIAGERQVIDVRIVNLNILTVSSPHSASGKSHLGLQLCVTSQLPTNELTESGGAILLTSERKVSFSRLEELARHILASHQEHDPERAALTARALLDNVHTMHITEVDGLEHALAYILPAMLARIAANTKRLPVRLLVIDSIGALFRSSFDANHSGLTQRSKMLCLIADKLKVLAEVHDMAVVVINQVTDVFNHPSSAAPRVESSNIQAETESSNQQYPSTPPELDNNPPEQPTMTYKVQSRYFSGQSYSYPKEASLGLVWANAVNVRLMLSRTGRRRLLDPEDLGRKRVKLAVYDKERRVEEGTTEEETFESTLIRRMHLVFSPFARQDMLDYVILTSGIHSVPSRSRAPPVAVEPSGSQVVPQGPVRASGSTEDFEGDLVFDDLSDLPPEFWEQGEEAVADKS
jgi:DNA repair protein RAD57